jgi:dihydrofolate reductase
MRKVVVSEFVSLDGVMEDPGGAENYAHGGWTRAYWSDEIGKFKLEELVAADALLLGRVTYQGFAAAWPAMSDPDGFADRMNNYPKYVVSRGLQTGTWNNTHILRGDVAKEVASLKQQSGRDILVAGSARLAQSLAQHNLVDEYRLLIYPVVLGGGKRLFGDTPDMRKLNLVHTQNLGSGVVAVVYTMAEA